MKQPRLPRFTVCSALRKLLNSQSFGRAFIFNYYLVKYLSVCFFSFFSLYATYTVNKDVYNYIFTGLGERN